MELQGAGLKGGLKWAQNTGREDEGLLWRRGPWGLCVPSYLRTLHPTHQCQCLDVPQTT